jgi:hypothetical protein
MSKGPGINHFEIPWSDLFALVHTWPTAHPQTTEGVPAAATATLQQPA